VLSDRWNRAEVTTLPIAALDRRHESVPSRWKTVRVDIPFSFDGEHGAVSADVVPNTEPVSLGKSERERGMPVCVASVEFSARGYRALLGWVQLVREPDCAASFGIDPFDLFADSQRPLPGTGSGRHCSTPRPAGVKVPCSGRRTAS